MAEITISVPEGIRDIIGNISETLYLEALKEVAHRNMSSHERRLKDIRKKIVLFETRYGKKYEEFSKNLPDTLKGHDDWIEWSYFVKIANELANKIQKFKLLAGK